MIQNLEKFLNEAMRVGKNIKIGFFFIKQNVTWCVLPLCKNGNIATKKIQDWMGVLLQINVGVRLCFFVRTVVIGKS